MSNPTNLVGAYTPYTCKIDAAAESAFQEATHAIIGVTYTPVAVSTQVVSGTNYKFFCNAVASTYPPMNTAAIVSIYKPLEGPAHVTSIYRIP